MAHPEALTPALLERVGMKLGVSEHPAPTLDGLQTFYAAWCRRCSPVSTLKKKKGQTSDQFGSHHHAMGGLAYAKTPGLGPTVPQPGLFPLSADQLGQHECDFDLSDPEWEATYLPV